MDRKETLTKLEDLARDENPSKVRCGARVKMPELMSTRGPTARAGSPCADLPQLSASSAKICLAFNYQMDQTGSSSNSQGLKPYREIESKLSKNLDTIIHGLLIVSETGGVVKRRKLPSSVSCR